MANTSTNSAQETGWRPSRLWYLLPVIVFIAGMAGMGAFLLNRLSEFGDNLVQVIVPGEMELTLNSGSYTIFHERLSTVDGRIFNVGNIAGLGVNLVSAAGEPVTLTPASTSGSYEFAGRSGASAFGFEIENPGVYLLSASYKGSSGPETVLAVGQGFGGNLLLTLAVALALAFGGAGLAVAIGWMVFIKRKRHLPTK